MEKQESIASWDNDTAIYIITSFRPCGDILQKVPALQTVEGVDGWIDLHLRPLRPKSIDIAKEAMIQSQTGSACTVCIEGSHHVHPTPASVREGIWQAGDCLITVSGITLEQLHWGDLLIQESNARTRAARKYR